MPDGPRTGGSGSVTTKGTSTVSGRASKRRPGPQATNHPSIVATVCGRSNHTAASADATSPASDPQSVFPQGDAEYSSVDVHGHNPEGHLAASSQTTSAANSTLGIHGFGSQPWVAPAGPFLDFAPQPLYEPTGELIYEDIHTFDQFDAPSLSRTSAAVPTTPRNPLLPPTHDSAGGTAANGTVSHAAFLPPSVPRSALKRKPSSTASTPIESVIDKKSRSSALQVIDPSAASNRSVTFERMSGVGPTSPEEGSSTSELPASSRAGQNLGAGRRAHPSSGSTPRPPNLPSTSSQGSTRGRGTRVSSGHPPSILQPEKVFPIQIGSDLFRLSGASISSDAPSYFTQFFEEQIRQNEESGGVRTLYIDRDPATFRDVARHLQGYYVKPVDGSHFVKLFADAQFYSLPRLIDQLFESEIFIQIGERHFQIPKDIFSEPGNSPNFFSLGFAVFFSSPGEVFPGLDRRGLLRPPSITPPYVPGRSAEIFAELLHLLRGYPLCIRNESHRVELLRDCRYFHLRGLEQKIIAHEISYNLKRQKHEICLRLEDVKPSGVSYTRDDTMGEKPSTGGWVYYARPFVDDTSYEMVVEIGGENTVVDLTDMRADLHGLAKARVSSLFQVVANKMNLPTNAPLGLMMLSGGRSSQSASPGHTPLSEDRVKVRFDTSTDIKLDGEGFEVDWESPAGQAMLHGPSTAPSDTDSDSDAMSEDPPLRAGPSMAGNQQRRTQARQPQASASSQGTGARGSLPVPPIQTTRLSAPSTKKRKRQSSQGELGEWTIRTGQWRLRVQPNSQDTIRGGFEIVFVGVKIDAYSSERARNARRGFLT